MFTKVIGKECKNGACKLVGIPQDAGLDICKCGTQLSPLVVPDNAKNAIVAGVVALFLLVGGWLGYEWIVANRAPIIAIKLLLRLIPEPPPPPPAAQAYIHWVIESRGEGTSVSENRDSDFKQVGGTHIYRTDRRYFSGDSFRIKLEHSSKKLYVFHRDSASLQRLAIANDEPVTVPVGSDAWIRLDNQPGTEEFVVVGADKPLSKLESVAEKSGRNELDPEFTNLENDKSVLVARIEMKHEARP